MSIEILLYIGVLALLDMFSPAIIGVTVYVLLTGKEKQLKLKNVDYTRVLKIKDASLPLLSAVSKNAKNLVITKITDDIIQDLDENTKESIKLDILANNLFNEPNIDYTNKIIQP